MKDRFREVANVWNWLPAFRMVAETQHLPTAASRLAVSASALSRTVGLLEAELGRPMFDRVGRRLVLNADGEAMLSTVRTAMRGVHDSILKVSGETLSGPVKVGSGGLVTRTIVLPALMDVVQEHPTLVPSMSTSSPSTVPTMLLDGSLDVAFLSTWADHAEVEVALLGHEPNHVWCGPGHPVCDREEVVLEDLLRYPFVAPFPGPDGVTPEGWPGHLKRHIAMTLERMDWGRDAVATGQFLAVLPDIIASSSPTPLWKVPIDVVPPTPIVALTRKGLSAVDRVEVVRRAVQARIKR